MQQPLASNNTSLAAAPEAPVCVNQTLDLLTAVATGTPLCLIALATVFGNCLVLLAVATQPSLRSSATAVFISNLAIADLLLGVCVLPFSSVLEVTHGCWYFGQLLCHVWASVDVLCCTASIMSLCAISLDRYIGVTRPLRHASIVTRRRAVALAAGVWLLSLLVSVGPLLGWRTDGDGAQPNICRVSDNRAYIVFSVIVSFYLPLCVVIFFYIRIYQAASRQTRSLANGVVTARMRASNSQQSVNSTASASATSATAVVTLRVHRGGGGGGGACGLTGAGRQHQQSRLHMAGKLARFKREKKAAKTLGIVVGVFILCWLPFFFIYPFKEILCRQCSVPDLLFKVVFWLGYCNSLCNPVIYACSNREFKRAFWRLLSCFCRRQRQKRPGQMQQRQRLTSAATTTLQACHRQQRSSSSGQAPTRGAPSATELTLLNRKNHHW
uniref:G_PROTEIN_RECEP_F1_2 domain-containing protein n=1 Tax=Macrostomum lignano TaxID=282301 RepID=A0A1I8ICY1_9PLAT